MKKRSKIPTIFGIILLVAGLLAGVFLVQNRQVFRLGASVEDAPKDVRIANITDSSFTVSWITSKPLTGFVHWGEGENSLNKTELDEVGVDSFTHTATIDGLSPQKTYYFKINSNGSDYDNNGLAWKTATGNQLPAISSSLGLISGSVLTSSGNPAANTLIYVTISGSSPLSTISSQNGSWVISTSAARSSSLDSYIQINNQTSLLEISANAGPPGVSTAQIYPQSAKPAPPLILGQVHDFRNQPPSETGETPRASLDLPEQSSPSSGFVVEEQSSTPSATTVTLESIDEGEVISTTEPEFFGEGPAGAEITISVESDPVTESVTIPNSGSWSWNPPASLSEGVHKITITWRDASGILRTLTRNFVVQAAEGPAFEATPSATISPTASPSATPKTTTSPTATTTAIPTTASATPESGVLTPTLLLFIMGVGTIVFSLLLWRKSGI